MKLLPFDLEKALAGAKVKTREGLDVKIAGYNKDIDGDGALVAWVAKGVYCWTKDGIYTENEESKLDLFLATEMREYWVCLCRKDNHTYTFVSSKKEAAEILAKADKAEIIKTDKFYEEPI